MRSKVESSIHQQFFFLWGGGNRLIVRMLSRPLENRGEVGTFQIVILIVFFAFQVNDEPSHLE